MAIFKKKSASSNNRSARNMPTEFVEVVSYDVEANEIIVKRIERNGEQVRVGFAPNENPGNYARPEVKHFTGKIRKPRDMTTQPGGIMKLNRQGITEDLTDGKLMVSWVDAWVRNPSEEFVLKGTASVTYLAPKEGLREDGTVGHKGLMTVLCDDRYADMSRDKVLSENIWKGEKPMMVESSAELATRLAELISKNLSGGVRFVDETADDDAKLAAAMVYPRYGHSASDVVSAFISNLDEEALSRIGDSIRCEVIPAISLQIGNDTAGEMFTGQKADGKASHMAKIREMLTATIEQKERAIQIPKFMDVGILVRMRVPKQGDAYLSVENLTPLFGPQSNGIANAVLAATTASSAVFANSAPAAKGEEKPAKPAEMEQPPTEPEQPVSNELSDASLPSSEENLSGVDHFFGEDTIVPEDDLSDIFGDSEPSVPSSSGNKMR